MKIKKTLSLLAMGVMVILLLASKPAAAQVELTPFGGIMFNGNVNFYQGKLKFSDEIDYGLILGIPIDYGVKIEISYTRSESEAVWTPGFSYEDDFPATKFNLNINYFQIGAIKDMEIQDDFFGYGGLTLGAAYYNTTTDISDVWRFAFGLQAGLKYFFSDVVGLRLQGRMLFPIYGGGTGMYCGIGTGGSSCGLSYGGSAFVLQGDITLGLVFRIGN